MKRKVYAIDFDGCLSLGDFPNCGPANRELVNVIKSIIAKPIEKRSVWLVLWTSRTGKYLVDAIEWLKNQGIIFDSVNSLPSKVFSFPDTSRKLWADAYVDDKAMSPEQFCEFIQDGYE